MPRNGFADLLVRLALVLFAFVLVTGCRDEKRIKENQELRKQILKSSFLDPAKNADSIIRLQELEKVESSSSSAERATTSLALARVLASSLKVEEREKGLLLLRQGVEKNDTASCIYLAEALYYQIPRDIFSSEKSKELFNLLQKCYKDAKSPLVERLLAGCYSEGLGVDQDKVRAAKLHVEAAAAGDAIAQYRVAVGAPDKQNAVMGPDEMEFWKPRKEHLEEYLINAASQGFGCAQNTLAYELERGRSIDVVNKSPVHWYHESAIRGCETGCMNYAKCLRDGKGIPQSRKNSIDWFVKAANLGVDEACFELASTSEILDETSLNAEACYRIGSIVAADQSWLYDSAKDPMTSLYRARLDGDYSKRTKDRKIAIMWFERAKEKGSIKAAISLGNQFCNSDFSIHSTKDLLPLYAGFQYQKPKEIENWQESRANYEWVLNAAKATTEEKALAQYGIGYLTELDGDLDGAKTHYLRVAKLHVDRMRYGALRSALECCTAGSKWNEELNIIEESLASGSASIPGFSQDQQNQLMTAKVMCLSHLNMPIRAVKVAEELLAKPDKSFKSYVPWLKYIIAHNLHKLGKNDLARKRLLGIIDEEKTERRAVTHETKPLGGFTAIVLCLLSDIEAEDGNTKTALELAVRAMDSGGCVGEELSDIMLRVGRLKAYLGQREEAVRLVKQAFFTPGNSAQGREHSLYALHNIDASAASKIIDERALLIDSADEEKMLLGAHLEIRFGDFNRALPVLDRLLGSPEWRVEASALEELKLLQLTLRDTTAVSEILSKSQHLKTGGFDAAAQNTKAYQARLQWACDKAGVSPSIIVKTIQKCGPLYNVLSYDGLMRPGVIAEGIAIEPTELGHFKKIAGVRTENGSVSIVGTPATNTAECLIYPDDIQVAMCLAFLEEEDTRCSFSLESIGDSEVDAMLERAEHNPNWFAGTEMGKTWFLCDYMLKSSVTEPLPSFFDGVTGVEHNNLRNDLRIPLWLSAISVLKDDPGVDMQDIGCSRFAWQLDARGTVMNISGAVGKSFSMPDYKIFVDSSLVKQPRDEEGRFIADKKREDRGILSNSRSTKIGKEAEVLTKRFEELTQLYPCFARLRETLKLFNLLLEVKAHGLAPNATTLAQLRAFRYRLVNRKEGDHYVVREVKTSSAIVGGGVHGVAVGHPSTLFGGNGPAGTEVGVTQVFASKSDMQGRLHHTFGDPSHNLDSLVNACGSRESAFFEVNKAANEALRQGKLNPNAQGILPSGNNGDIINVSGMQVRLIGGRITEDGVSISSFSRRGLE